MNADGGPAFVDTNVLVYSLEVEEILGVRVVNPFQEAA